jgi:SAM-dependent methyltransferase
MDFSVQGLLALPPVRRAARTAADWVDLQLTYIMDQMAAIAPRAKGRLLDVGCGEKPYEHIFRPYVTDYVGVEYDATFSATESSRREGKPDFYYDGKRLPFEDKSFDTVISIQVFEHTPDAQTVLNEIARVVKKDGLVVVCAPFSFRLHEEPHDYFRYTPHGLRTMFDRAGLEVEGIWNQGDLWSVIGHKLNTYLARNVARLDGVAQQMGKMGHEDRSTTKPRYWTLPIVVPTMGVVSGMSRVLDRVAHDGTETLSFLAFGHPKR